MSKKQFDYSKRLLERKQTSRISDATIRDLLKAKFAEHTVCCGGQGLVVGCPTCRRRR